MKWFHISIFLILGGVFFSIPDPALAGTSRTVSLGGAPEYFSDTANIHRWYSSLINQPDQVAFELGDLINGQHEALNTQGLIGHGGGVHARLTEDGRWGAVAFFVQDHLKNGEKDGAFSAYWARSFGSLQVGIGGSFSTYGISRSGVTTGDRADVQYLHQYGLGLGYQISPGFRVEMAGEFLNSMTASGGAVYNLPITDDWDTFGLRARGFLDLNAKLVLVPVIDYLSDVRLDLDQSSDRPVAADRRVLRLGLGANYSAKADLLLIFSTEYRSGRANMSWSEYSAGADLWDRRNTDFYQIKLRSGAEASVLSWLKLRASVNYVRVHEEILLVDDLLSDRDETHYVEYVVSSLALGAGLHFGSFSADLAYNDSPPLADMGRGAELFTADSGKGYSSVTLSWEF